MSCFHVNLLNSLNAERLPKALARRGDFKVLLLQAEPPWYLRPGCDKPSAPWGRWKSAPLAHNKRQCCCYYWHVWGSLWSIRFRENLSQVIFSASHVFLDLNGYVSSKIWSFCVTFRTDAHKCAEQYNMNRWIWRWTNGRNFGIAWWALIFLNSNSHFAACSLISKKYMRSWEETYPGAGVCA